jgi:hypothetical protein
MLKKAPEASIQQEFISAFFIFYFVLMSFQFIAGFSSPTKLWLL